MEARERRERHQVHLQAGPGGHSAASRKQHPSRFHGQDSEQSERLGSDRERQVQRCGADATLRDQADGANHKNRHGLIRLGHLHGIVRLSRIRHGNHDRGCEEAHQGHAGAGQQD